MPQIVQTADQIARESQQDVLLVDFRTSEHRAQMFPDRRHDARSRAAFLKWLAATLPSVEVHEAFPPLGTGTILYPYYGCVALVVSEREQRDDYKRIVEEWEHSDGSPKNQNVRLFIVPNKPREGGASDPELGNDG